MNKNKILSLEDFFIQRDGSIKDALKKLDKTAEKALLVVQAEGKLLGTITDGDVRRFILNGGSLEDTIAKVYNKKPIYLKQNEFSLAKAKDIFITNKIDLIPIVDEHNKVIDFTTWSQVFSGKDILKAARSKIDIPVVIMAGGRSTRLEPVTKIIPKPLIPIGDKPIVEIIIDEFKKQGVNNYYLILNYKSEMIESYFNNIERDYGIQYIKEAEFHGTAGGLRLLEEKIGKHFIVSNCDVIVRANFEEVIDFHKKHGASLTVLSSFQHYSIPYGVVIFEEGGQVLGIQEKPEYTFMVNTGVYILNKECLGFIPKGTHFDMTDLIKILIKSRKKVFTYPVNENDYIDIGQWEEYKKAVEKIQFLG